MFTVTPTPNAISLASGQSAEVVFAFEGVPADVVRQIVETWALDGVTLDINIQATQDNPTPSLTGSVLPEGVTSELLSLTETQAVIRYTQE